MLYYINIITFLQSFKDIRSYYARKLGYVILLPLYNLFAFFVRFAGMLNSVKRKSTWKTKTFTEEMDEDMEILTKDWAMLPALRKKVKALLERQEDTDVI